MAKRKAKRRGPTAADAAAARAIGAASVGRSAGGVLVASAAPAPVAYVAIRRNGDGEIVRRLPVESSHPKHVGRVIAAGTRDLDMRTHHVDDSDVEAVARARGLR